MGPPPVVNAAALEALPIVQIVPPGAGGVRDFAACLRLAWQAAGRPSAWLALDAAAVRAAPLAQQLSALHADGRVSLLVHFSGYGFARRGLCGWLARELEQAQTQLGDRLRVVTMFHELYASSPPWRTAFWLLPAQVMVARALVRASHAVRTNSEHHALQLRRRLGAAGRIAVCPVLSTVGEPTAVPVASARRPQLVVFGAGATRHRALARLPQHADGLRNAGVAEIIEIGSGRPWIQATGLPTRFLGALPAATVSALLAESALGLIDYPSVHLGKSSVFAAYAAHGCVVLNTAPPGPDADGLAAGHHYLELAAGRTVKQGTEERDAVSARARTWYTAHALGNQAAEIASACLAEHPQH